MGESSTAAIAAVKEEARRALAERARLKARAYEDRARAAGAGGAGGADETDARGAESAELREESRERGERG